MLQPLEIAVAQPVCVPGDVAANVVAHRDVVGDADARLVVFPELSISGYVLDSPALDVTADVFAPLVGACADRHTIALIGAPVRLSGADYIATLSVTEGGVRVAYCKTFLGADEALRFVAGDGPRLITVDGWRIGVGVCKDTGIDEHIDATLDLGIDLYVAGLVHHADELHELGRRAARITERGSIPVAFASAAGCAGPTHPDAAGHSAIWAADGTILAGTTAAPGHTAQAVLQPLNATGPPARRGRSAGGVR